MHIALRAIQKVFVILITLNIWFEKKDRWCYIKYNYYLLSQKGVGLFESNKNK